MNPKSSNREYLPLLALVAVSLIVILLTFHKYGESWDDDNFFSYASESLRAYSNIGNPNYVQTFDDPTLRYYGPWFLMLIVMAARALPGLVISETAHILTFIVFLLGVALFYLLARRWFKPWSAFGATLLFATQPLLWGHGLVNSRDIPFMAAFLASVYFGLRMVDSLGEADMLPLNRKTAATTPLIKQDWSSLKLSTRILLIAAMGIGITLAGWFALHLLETWTTQIPLAVDTTSARDIDQFLRPVLAKFWAAAIFILLSLLFFLILFLPLMPNLRKYLIHDEFGPYGLRIKHYLTNISFYLASFALGLTVATRILGVFALLVVGAYALYKHGRGVILSLLVYGILALPVVYITWPYLWPEPLLRLLITLKVMMRFPWPGKVLFGGNYYAGNELPRSYLPTLFSIQLTEPVIFLSLLGVSLMLFLLIKRGQLKDFGIVIGVWFLIPFGFAILGRPYLYDNFRQMIFLLPPLFLLAGLAIEKIGYLLKLRALQWALVVVLALPGIYGIYASQPYQYAYYNSFVGGMGGAFRKYEMDYWATAFRDAADYLNENAPQNADVVVWGPVSPLARFTRPDLNLYSSQVPATLPSGDFYAVFSTRGDEDLKNYAGEPALYTVEKNGAVLAVVKYIK